VSAALPPEMIGRARHLMRALDRAALAVIHPDGAWPYASLVLVAVAHDLAPILLISQLAEHTKAIAADAKVALLFDGTAGIEKPLTGPRLSVLGRAQRSDDARLAARYLARHPDAALYAGFKDFAFYRVAIERAHLVAGFGAIHWIEAAALAPPPAPALEQAEAEIVAHMNQDHGEALDLYAGRLLGLAGEGWRMTGLDADGLDLRRLGQVARLDFEAPVGTAAEARRALVSLAGKARGLS